MMQQPEPLQQPQIPGPPTRRRPPGRRTARWLLPLLLVLLVFGAVAVVGIAFLAASFGGSSVASGSILELSLSGPMGEAPDPLAEVFPGLAGPVSLFEVRAALERAATDDEIAAFRLNIDSVQLGWGATQELLSLIDGFRKSGKPVHAFLRGDMVGDLEYMASLAADKIWLAPGAGVFINGLRAEVEFWRGTLDKLHIEPQYMMMKEYKSAGEINTRYEMSRYFREATRAVLDDIWQACVDEIVTRRQRPRDEVLRMTDIGLMNTSELAEASWVDALGYEEELRAELRAIAGTETYRAVSVRKYLQGQDGLFKGGRGPRIAVVFGEGPIVASSASDPFSNSFSGPQVASAIRQAADDDVAAILFRVDSPGGSVVGSDHVWRAIEYARKERSLPVVVSFSSVAGSGGYWVSMGADAIVAQPTTITGSIGVVFGKLNIRGLYELIGASVDTIQLGKNADLLSFVESFDTHCEPGEERCQSIQIDAWMTNIYDEFKAKVAAGRGLEVAAVEEIAKGRIWSGVDASNNGLVDRLGGYSEAIELIRDSAGIAQDEAIRLVPYPQSKTLWELLFDEGTVRAAMTRHSQSPIAEVSATLRELAKPGAWLLTPSLVID